MAKDCRSCKEVARLEKALATTEAAYRREKERADKLHTAIIVTLDTWQTGIIAH
jgi:hypothetical protein